MHRCLYMQSISDEYTRHKCTYVPLRDWNACRYMHHTDTYSIVHMAYALCILHIHFVLCVHMCAYGIKNRLTYYKSYMCYMCWTYMHICTCRSIYAVSRYHLLQIHMWVFLLDHWKINIHHVLIWSTFCQTELWPRTTCLNDPK